MENKNSVFGVAERIRDEILKGKVQRYTYIPIMPRGVEDPAIVVDAPDKETAQWCVYNCLTEEQKKNNEYIKWVDLQDIPEDATK